MSKRQNFLDVALSTFYRSGKGNKIRRSVRSIVSHLNEHPIGEQAVVLEHIAVIMTRECFSKSPEVQEKFWQRNLLLGDSIGEYAFRTANMAFLCSNFLDQQFPPVDGNVELFTARQFIASRFYAYVGSSLDLTLEFCRMVFGYLIKNEETRVREKGKTVNDEIEIRVRRSIIMSMCLPASENITQKRWVNNLLEATGRGNDEVEQFYTAAFELCVDADVSMKPHFSGSVFGDPKGIRVMSQSALDAGFQDTESKLHLVDWLNLHVVVPDRLMPKIEQWVVENVDTWKRDTLEATGFLKWFTSHTSQIGARFDELSNTILTKHRYGVRPMGFDSFLVNVSTLRCIGITSFSFYPEGEQFPNLKIAVTVRKTCYGLCQFWMYLRDFELTTVEDVFLNWHDTNVATVRSMLEYIVIDALHRIVVAKPEKNLDDDIVERSEELRDVTPTSMRVKVRPFIRRLPLGFEASDEARKLAFLQLGWNLMAGMTFVRSHDRWAGLPAGKPAPLFKYTDEVVRKSIV